MISKRRKNLRKSHRKRSTRFQRGGAAAQVTVANRQSGDDDGAGPQGDDYSVYHAYCEYMEKNIYTREETDEFKTAACKELKLKFTAKQLKDAKEPSLSGKKYLFNNIHILKSYNIFELTLDDAKDLKEAGFSARELMNIGFSKVVLIEAGFTAHEVASFDILDLYKHEILKDIINYHARVNSDKLNRDLGLFKPNKPLTDKNFKTCTFLKIQ